MQPAFQKHRTIYKHIPINTSHKSTYTEDQTLLQLTKGLQQKKQKYIVKEF